MTDGDRPGIPAEHQCRRCRARGYRPADGIRIGADDVIGNPGQELPPREGYSGPCRVCGIVALPESEVQR